MVCPQPTPKTSSTWGYHVTVASACQPCWHCPEMSLSRSGFQKPSLKTSSSHLPPCKELVMHYKSRSGTNKGWQRQMTAWADRKALKFKHENPAHKRKLALCNLSPLHCWWKDGINDSNQLLGTLWEWNPFCANLRQARTLGSCMRSCIRFSAYSRI